jgi:hypothetical protein
MRIPRDKLPEVVVILVALGFYIGTYYATVRPNGHRPEYYWPGEYTLRQHPKLNLAVHAAFYPIHWLDRLFRPHLWPRERIQPCCSHPAPPETRRHLRESVVAHLHRRHLSCGPDCAREREARRVLEKT